MFANKSCDDRIAFFFVQYDNADSLQAETIIRSIIRQSIDIVTLSEDLESRLRQLDRKLFVELGDWAGLLRQRIELSRTFYIIIDGLDECDSAERRALLDTLISLTTTVSRLRIFISGRESLYVDLRSRFSRMEHLSMASDSLRSDIRLYVEAALQEGIRNKDLEVELPSLLEEIKETLTQHADGM